VVPFLAGAPAIDSPPLDLEAAAVAIGGFLGALHVPAPPDAPVNPFRGVPLAERAAAFEANLDLISGDGAVSPAALLPVWEAALAAPVHDGAPLWLHGDLHPANILVDGGWVSGVIDFGDITSGDPATDLAVAWLLLPLSSRGAFRAAYAAAGGARNGADGDALWLRARGWALHFAVVYLAHAADNPPLLAVGRRTLQRIARRETVLRTPDPCHLHRGCTAPGLAGDMTDTAVLAARQSRYRLRAAAAALAVGGVLFAAYPALRPYTDETTLEGARAFASTAWVVSHTMGMLGFIGLAIGLLGVHAAQSGAADSRRSFWALLVTWIGAGLTLTYYGAEAFGLRVIGRLAVKSGDPALLDLAHQLRFGPGAVLFGAGMVLLAAGGIMTAVVTWRDGGLMSWGGALTGIGLVLYLPQFLQTPPVRAAHGVLLAVGCLWLAMGLWNRRPAGDSPAGQAAATGRRSSPAPERSPSSAAG
jgi:hypothetical protein